MKSYTYIILLFISIFVSSCAYDNYDEPSSQFTGKLTYQGEPLGLSHGEVTFQLYEPGWQLTAPIYVNVAQDGSFSALLFDATYKLIIPQNQGPFVNIANPETNSDTIIVNLSGRTEKNIEVMPFYLVSNPQYNLSGRKLSVTFGARQVISGPSARNIEFVKVFVNKTTLVDNRNDYNINPEDKDAPLARMDGGSITDVNSISLSIDIPEITPTQNYVFARVGIKIAGVEKMIFSQVQKIDL